MAIACLPLTAEGSERFDERRSHSAWIQPVGLLGAFGTIGGPVYSAGANFAVSRPIDVSFDAAFRSAVIAEETPGTTLDFTSLWVRIGPRVPVTFNLDRHRLTVFAEPSLHLRFANERLQDVDAQLSTASTRRGVGIGLNAGISIDLWRRLHLAVLVGARAEVEEGGVSSQIEQSSNGTLRFTPNLHFLRIGYSF